MANVIGTETLLKGQLYQKIKDLLTANGWQNISSNAATDFDVFYSTGEQGDKSLYFQLKDISATATSTNVYFAMRFINKYTPGTPGVAGTFDRSAATWVNVCFFSGVLPIDTPVTLSYQVNKDRIVFLCDVPLAVLGSGLSGNIVFIGSPTLFEPEINCRSLVFASGIGYAAASPNNTVSVNSPPYSDAGPTGLHYTVVSSKFSPPGEYNNADKRTMSEITYGSATEGLRGKLDGFFVLNPGNTRTGHGDLLTDGSSTYKVVKLTTFSSALFNDTNMYAFQIA